MIPKLTWRAAAAAGLLLVFCVQPAFSVTDYMFYSVNGDSTATSMIQGDSVGWGANCSVGGSLRWEIWYDVGGDGTINALEDILIGTFVTTDGDTSGHGLPDISPTPDGWYVSPPLVMGVAAGQYIFKAVDLTDSTFVQKPLTCTEMTSPPNTFSGHLIISGHPIPDPALVKNRWVQANSQEAEDQIWSAMTNDSGRFQINVGRVGTGLTFRVSPPEIPGFTSPGERTLLASGHTDSVDFVYVGPPFGKTDYMFYSVNGDSTATSMVQGDLVAWGANCAVGGSLRWEIWYDVDGDEVISVPGDVQIATFIATDGNTSGHDGPPDNSPVPDGWYITPAMILGVAPGHYIFKAVNLDDPSEVQKPLVCSEMSLPQNTFSGWVIVPGHPAPDPGILENRWVQAEGQDSESQIWTAMTNDSGRFQINIGYAGTGKTFRVSPPEIPGFVSPGEQMLLAAGHTENVNFEYVAPADSVWGYVLDHDSAVIMGPVGLTCSPSQGSGGKDIRTDNGRYVFVFGPSELGAWSIWCSGDGLIPAYMTPSRFDFDNSTQHGIRHDFVCPTADTVMYARITENQQPPSHQYKINVRQEPSGVETGAVSNTGGNNVVTLHISKLFSNGYRAYIDTWSDNYPIPPGYTPDYNFAFYHPGDTVPLNLQRGIIVSDTIKSDPADPPVDWDSVWVWMQEYQWYEVNPDINGVFTLSVPAGSYNIGVNAPGYFVNTFGHQLPYISHDTVGGFGFEINRAHCRVHGSLTNVPLPLTNPVWIWARGDSVTHPTYFCIAPVDSVTGAYEMMLCDGDWTVDAPDIIPGRIPPAPLKLSIANAPDTVRIVDLEYTEATNADEAGGGNLPVVFALEQNYPNPFNPATVIGYSVPVRSHVTIDVFNILGQIVRTLVDEEKSSGTYGITWDGDDAAGRPLSTGLYLYRIKAGDFVQTRKMLLLK